MATCPNTFPPDVLEELESGTLSEDHAQTIYPLGEGSVVFGLLLRAERIAEQETGLAIQPHEKHSIPSNMKLSSPELSSESL